MENKYVNKEVDSLGSGKTSSTEAKRRSCFEPNTCFVLLQASITSPLLMPKGIQLEGFHRSYEILGSKWVSIVHKNYYYKSEFPSNLRIANIKGHSTCEFPSHVRSILRNTKTVEPRSTNAPPICSPSSITGGRKSDSESGC